MNHRTIWAYFWPMNFFLFCVGSVEMVTLDNPCSHTKLPNESGRYIKYIEELNKRPCCGCNAGEYLRNFCSANDSSDTDCQACPVDTCMPFNAHFNHNCIVPSITKEMCRKDQQYFEGNATVCPKCICRDGYFEVSSTECESHTPCKIGFGVVEIGTPEKDTVCQKCGRGFESNIVSATEPCRKKRKQSKPIIETTQQPYMTTEDVSTQTIMVLPHKDGEISVIPIVVIIISIIVVFLLFFAILYRYCKRNRNPSKKRNRHIKNEIGIELQERKHDSRNEKKTRPNAEDENPTRPLLSSGGTNPGEGENPTRPLLSSSGTNSDVGAAPSGDQPTILDNSPTSDGNSGEDENPGRPLLSSSGTNPESDDEGKIETGSNEDASGGDDNNSAVNRSPPAVTHDNINQITEDVGAAPIGDQPTISNNSPTSDGNSGEDENHGRPLLSSSGTNPDVGAAPSGDQPTISDNSPTGEDENPTKPLLLSSGTNPDVGAAPSGDQPTISNNSPTGDGNSGDVASDINSIQSIDERNEIQAVSEPLCLKRSESFVALKNGFLATETEHNVHLPSPKGDAASGINSITQFIDEPNNIKSGGSISSENNGTMSKNDKKHFVGAITHSHEQINAGEGDVALYSGCSGTAYNSHQTTPKRSISSEHKVSNDGPDEKHLTARPDNVQPQNFNNVTGEDKQIKDFFLNLASKRNIRTCNHNDVTRFGLNAGLTEMQLDEELHDCAMGQRRKLSDYFYHVICKLHSVKGNQFNLGFVEKHLRQCQLNSIAGVLKNSITNSR